MAIAYCRETKRSMDLGFSQSRCHSQFSQSAIRTYLAVTSGPNCQRMLSTRSGTAGFLVRSHGRTDSSHTTKWKLYPCGLIAWTKLSVIASLASNLVIVCGPRVVHVGLNGSEVGK